MTATGTGRRRPARRGEGSRLREEIVDAAAREIARTGDAATLTLRGVAREVGVAATSIYLHFPSVEELVDEVKRCRFGELQAVLEAAAATAGDDPVARVRARMHAYARYGAEHPGAYAVMFTARLAPAGPPRPPRFAGALDDLERDVAAALGPRDAAAEAHLVAVQLWTGLHGTLTLRLLRPLKVWPDVELQVDHLVDRLLGP